MNLYRIITTEMNKYVIAEENEIGDIIKDTMFHLAAERMKSNIIGCETLIEDIEKLEAIKDNSTETKKFKDKLDTLVKYKILTEL